MDIEELEKLEASLEAKEEVKEERRRKLYLHVSENDIDEGWTSAIYVEQNATAEDLVRAVQKYLKLLFVPETLRALRSALFCFLFLSYKIMLVRFFLRAVVEDVERSGSPTSLLPIVASSFELWLADEMMHPVQKVHPSSYPIRMEINLLHTSLSMSLRSVLSCPRLGMFPQSRIEVMFFSSL